MSLRQLAAATAVALAFNAPANAEGLISSAGALDRYSGTMSERVSRFAENTPEKDVARLAAGGFFVNFEKALSSPAAQAQLISYPKQRSSNQLGFVAVLPPQGMQGYDIPVCVEIDDKTLTLAISAKGEVKDLPWTGPVGDVAKREPACKPFAQNFRAAFNQEVAKRNGTPPPAAAQGAPPSAPGKVSETSASTRPAVAGVPGPKQN